MSLEANRLAKRLNAASPDALVGLRFGVVTAVDYTTLPWLVSAQVNGEDVSTTDIATMADYCPRVGDSIILVKNGADLVVWGSYSKDMRPRVSVYRGAPQTLGSFIANGSPMTWVSFTGADYDTDEMWDIADPTKIHINTPGLWIPQATARWTDYNVGRRRVSLELNLGGNDIGDVDGPPDPVEGHCHQQVTGKPRWYAAGDYMRVNVEQESATNLDVVATFSMRWVAQNAA